MKKLFAASLSLALTIGVAAGAFAQQGADASYRGTVNVDVIDTDNETFLHRIKGELGAKPAPQVGMSRGEIEALYGPANIALAPNKGYHVYTNEIDLTDGRMFERSLKEGTLRVYEVTYNMGDAPNAQDKATDVKLRVVPRIGDHRNLITKLMGNPEVRQDDHSMYMIPAHRYVFYNDVLSSPFEAVNMYFNREGELVGQEFVPSRKQGGYALTSAGRYIPVRSYKYQTDTKINW